MTDIDNYNADTGAVVMMTMHSAKGLEFPIVLIVGMEEGVFPGIQSIYNPNDLEEERRLAYVGITRAKQKLYLTNTRSRMLYGSTTHNPPSRFLMEIPSALLEQTGNMRSLRQPYAAYGQQGKKSSTSYGFSFEGNAKASAACHRVGDTVAHKTFGTGVVLSAQTVGNDTLLEIAFDKAGTKKIMANFAKLTKL